MNDADLIRRGDAKARCQKIIEEARGYSIPQMAMGAIACRDDIAVIPAADPPVDASVAPDPVAYPPEVMALVEAARRISESLGPYYDGWGAKGSLDAALAPFDDAAP